jgi:hypothetical protein
MDILSFNALASYWSAALVATNILIFFNILGALVLGLLVGYERAYHGHAAGMRTYGLVCMASAALTVIAGYPGFWFGGQVATAANVDPTRVVQGIVTGIGFLGAGVIMVPPRSSDAEPGMEITVRFSFKRNGDILAQPRTTYTKAGASSGTRAMYFNAITAALNRCTPMNFSKGLAATIPGHPFAIRFVDNRTDCTKIQCHLASPTG